ncbi:short-chain dehydrogenase reductase [Stemphylium lycopersici]|uniref:Short-chain dehydrogenase reductase n=1 Tax=Stemphylium lycopersici TaxID=183478 RepID=A0A364NF06_STELY|nr:short-chain dehydrogenase reductase [Stemphylium lycopersici]RAR10951.1 short-chain dehydrogenase reductase [Stemphylium lycopersici]RAR15693.1 short-chain dehydrogenase reductase [Stemphylium lycopersici]
MVSIAHVHAHNASLKSLPPNLVAVFVGGTSGIGLFTAREFVRNTRSPHVYLIGRNATEASKIIEELHSINSASQVSFIQKDISLLKNVDGACDEIKSKEKQVNMLVMTSGYLTLSGRDETVEGLDRKFSVHYYARMRFIQQLTPLLDKASEANELSRVLSVLDPQAGLRLGGLNYSDLSLKQNFSLKNVMVHASAMTSLSISHLAKQHPKTSYIHAYPSGVETGVTRELFGRLNGVFTSALHFLARWFIYVPQVESGERHLFAATSPRYAPKASVESSDVVGSDGIMGSGSYLLNWNGDVLADTKKAQKLREEGGVQKVWEHTEEVMTKIEEQGKYQT